MSFPDNLSPTSPDPTSDSGLIENEPRSSTSCATPNINRENPEESTKVSTNGVELWIDLNDINEEVIQSQPEPAVWSYGGSSGKCFSTHI